MQLLINGDIYIKIKPLIFNPSKETFEKNKKDLYNIDFYEAHNGSDKYSNEMRKIIGLIGETLEKKGAYDYSYIEDFHVLKTDGNTVSMKLYERCIEKELSFDFNIDSPKMGEYKRFVDFLYEAEFVGRKLLNSEHITVLYKTDYAMCIQYEVFPNYKYIKMLDIRYLDRPLGKVDETVEKYRNKKLLFKTVVQEISEIADKIAKRDDFGRKK